MKLNKIYNMDCLEGLKQLEDNSINLVITSPPYNMNDKRYYKKYEDNLTSEGYINWLNSINKELFRVLKDDGVICYNISYNRNSPFEYIKVINKMLDTGFILNETISWLKKGMPIIEVRNMTRDFELIFILSKNKKYKCNQKRKQIISNVWKLNNKNCQEKINNACFPLELPLKCIDLFSDEKDLILDCFMGSGTTAQACKDRNRNYIGFEIDKEQFIIANKKIKKVNNQKLNKWVLINK